MSCEEDDEFRGFYEDLYKCTHKVDIKSYFNEYSKEISKFTRNKEQTLEGYMNASIDEDKINILAEYCSIDKLTVPGEIEKRTTHRLTWRKEIFDSEHVPDDINLKTISEAKIRRNMRKEMKSLKYSGETPVHYEKMKNVKQNCATPYKDTMVYIRIYVPHKCSNSTRIGKMAGRISLDSIVAIRGDQSLAVLRDKITCLSDHEVLKDVSQNIFQDTGPSAKDVYPSAFFYIEGVFYNDNRYINSTDSSKVIRDWAEDRKFGPFRVDFMEETRIDSLSVRFGYPWIYHHQGRCEHIIVFSDARLFGHDDELSLSVYPRIIRTKHQHVRYCMTCGTYSARWITMDNDRLPHNPCFFCDRCFKSYNYVDGQKVGNFKAYNYPCDKQLLSLINEIRKKPKTKKVSKK